MAIQHLILYLFLEHRNLDQWGQETLGTRSIDIDLATENVAEFLARIPKDISDRSMIWLTLTKSDGEILAFVDGYEPFPNEPINPDDPTSSYQRVSGERADLLRYNAILWTQRRNERLSQSPMLDRESDSKPAIQNRLATLIEKIRARYGMYLGYKSIFRLRAFLNGYFEALREIDGAEQERHLLDTIQSVVEKKHRFRVSQGWDGILCFVNGTEAAAYDEFMQIWVEQILPKVDQLDAEGEEKLRMRRSPPS